MPNGQKTSPNLVPLLSAIFFFCVCGERWSAIYVVAMKLEEVFMERKEDGRSGTSVNDTNAIGHKF